MTTCRRAADDAGAENSSWLDAQPVFVFLTQPDVCAPRTHLAMSVWYLCRVPLPECSALLTGREMSACAASYEAEACVKLAVCSGLRSFFGESGHRPPRMSMMASPSSTGLSRFCTQMRILETANAMPAAYGMRCRYAP